MIKCEQVVRKLVTLWNRPVLDSSLICQTTISFWVSKRIKETSWLWVFENLQKQKNHLFQLFQNLSKNHRFSLYIKNPDSLLVLPQLVYVENKLPLDLFLIWRILWIQVSMWWMQTQLFFSPLLLQIPNSLQLSKPLTKECSQCFVLCILKNLKYPAKFLMLFFWHS